MCSIGWLQTSCNWVRWEGIYQFTPLLLWAAKSLCKKMFYGLQFSNWPMVLYSGWQQKFRSSFICKPYVGHLFCSCCRRGSAKAIILTLNFNRSFRRRWNFCIFILENATGEQYLPVSTLVKYKNYLWVKVYKQHKLLTL